MADTAEMLRLMRHAADLLDACDPTTNVERVAAITTAKTVLRMVAACMADEPAEELTTP